jgi:hypothetical protein
MGKILVLVESGEGNFGDVVFTGYGIQGLCENIASHYENEIRAAVNDEDIEFFRDFKLSLLGMLERSNLVKTRIGFVGYEILRPIDPLWHDWMLIAFEDGK